MSFEWEAIQPKRARLVKPTLYVCVDESTTLMFEAKVFADSFPEPLILRAQASIKVIHQTISLISLIPDWKELWQEALALKKEEEEEEEEEATEKSVSVKKEKRVHLIGTRSKKQQEEQGN